MSEGNIQKGVQANLELDHEKVSFLMPDGSTFKVQLQTILDKGDTQSALVYAQLIVLQNLATRQSDLAAAMVQLANAVRAMVPSSGQNSAAMTPNAVETLVDGMFDRMTKLFVTAGMKLPNSGE